MKPIKHLMHLPEGNVFLEKDEIMEKVKGALANSPTEYRCPYHVWYEDFEGCGKPSAAVYNIIAEGMEAAGWENIGTMRYEKFGVVNPSFRNTNYANAAKERAGEPMIQHKFHIGKHYKGPDGRIFWLAVIEVFDMRCFQWQDGKYVGTMVEIDPYSEYAKQMVEVQV